MNFQYGPRRCNTRCKSLSDEFVDLYCASNLKQRVATWQEAEREEDGGPEPDGRWREYSYDEIIARDKTSLDISWLRDDSLEDTENLLSPSEIANEIVELLTGALNEFKSVEEALAEEDDELV